MTSLLELYENFTGTTTQSLKDQIRTELSQQIGIGFSGCKDRLERCFEQTEYYTNYCQKSGKQPTNGVITRKSGEPYINHTLRVALILISEKVNDFDVIIASIMHDLFEDTTYTYEIAKREFGAVVADLINCVTNVAEAQQTLETTEAEAENIDYSNIIKRCSSRKIAFYIKFADRLDNLLTMSVMPREKQLKKVSYTKKYLLPLMDILGAKRFKSYIEDAIFKIESNLSDSNINNYELLRIKIQNSNAFQSTSSAIATLKQYFCGKRHVALDCRIILPTTYEVWTQLKSKGYEVSQFNSSRLYYNVFLLPSNTATRITIKEIASAILTSEELDSFVIEEIKPNMLVLVDDIQNHYLVKVLSVVDFNIMQYGSTESSIPIVEAYSIEDELYPDKIIVYNAPNNEQYSLPRGSTVTDFAFRLGDEVGLFMAAARLNGIPADFSNELHEKDVVEIFTTSDRNYTIKVSWLLHCKTVRAKHSLCTHLQSQIDRLIEQINKYEK